MQAMFRWYTILSRHMFHRNTTLFLMINLLLWVSLQLPFLRISFLSCSPLPFGNIRLLQGPLRKTSTLSTLIGSLQLHQHLNALARKPIHHPAPLQLTYLLLSLLFLLVVLLLLWLLNHCLLLHYIATCDHNQMLQ